MLDIGGGPNPDGVENGDTLDNGGPGLFDDELLDTGGGPKPFGAENGDTFVLGGPKPDGEE